MLSQVRVANLGKAGTELSCHRYLSPIWERRELMCVITGTYHQFGKGGN